MSGYCSKLWLNIVTIYILPSILVACPLAASRKYWVRDDVSFHLSMVSGESGVDSTGASVVEN